MSFAKNQNISDLSETPEADLKRAKEAAKHFEPAYDRILVKREVSALERKMKKSSLVLGDAQKDLYKSSEGYLLKCGPTCDDEAIALIGKRILFAKYSGEDIIIPLPDGTKEEFVLATDRDIFG